MRNFSLMRAPKVLRGRDTAEIWVMVNGIVSIEGGQLSHKHPGDPGIEVMYHIWVPRHTWAQPSNVIITDGEQVWLQCYSVPYSALPDPLANEVKLRPADIDPRYKGLVRSALSAYLEGKGNRATCNGARIRIDNCIGIGSSYAGYLIHGIADFKGNENE